MAVCVLTTSPANQSVAAIHSRLALLQAQTDLVIRQMSAHQTLFRSHSNLIATRQVSVPFSLFMATATAIRATAIRLAQNKWQTLLTV